MAYKLLKDVLPRELIEELCNYKYDYKSKMFKVFKKYSCVGTFGLDMIEDYMEYNFDDYDDYDYPNTFYIKNNIEYPLIPHCICFREFISNIDDYDSDEIKELNYKKFFDFIDKYNKMNDYIEIIKYEDNDEH